MHRTIISLIALVTVATAAMLAGCGSGSPVTLPVVADTAATGIPTGGQTQPTATGVTLYAAQCAGCHGPLSTSTKKGTSLSRLQTAISSNLGGMGFLATLSTADMQAIVTSLGSSTSPTPVPAPAPSPATLDGAALYAAQCAGCHGVLATSSKAGASATLIQTAISGNIGGMGALAALTAPQVQAIADVLAPVAPSPTPAPACGSCHAIPPASGHHSAHRSRSCSTCHGSGYSSTSVNTATHNNGVKNLTNTVGWNANSRSCANSCHGSKIW